MSRKPAPRKAKVSDSDDSDADEASLVPRGRAPVYEKPALWPPRDAQDLKSRAPVDTFNVELADRLEAAYRAQAKEEAERRQRSPSRLPANVMMWPPNRIFASALLDGSIDKSLREKLVKQGAEMPEALEDVDDLLEIDEDGDGDGVGGGGGGGARRRGLDASQDRAEGDKPERGSGRKKGRLDESAKGDAEGKESESSEDASAAAEMSEPSEGDYGEAHGDDGSE